MTGYQQQPIDPATISDKSRRKTADAMSNDNASRLGKLACKPFEGSGTILASPIFYGRFEAAKRVRPRLPDPSVIVNEGRHAIGCQVLSKAVVIVKSYPRASINKGDGSGPYNVAAA